MDRGMKQEQLATLKNKIRSVLMSKKGGVTAANFSGDYHALLCERIPFADYGYSALKDFINALPDVVEIKMVRGELMYYAVPNDDTQHLQNLVMGQKGDQKPAKNRWTPIPKPVVKSGSNFQTSASSAFSSKRGDGGGFPHPAPTMRAITRRKSPMGIGTNLHDASSFTVTVDHAVERRSVCCSGDGGLGGARMLSCAMKGISDDRQLEHQSRLRRYELAPRFRTSPLNLEKSKSGRLSQGNGAVCEAIHSLGTQPPPELANWTTQLLKDHPSGLMSSSYLQFYHRKFGAVPEELVMEQLHGMPHVHVEFSPVLDNQSILYLVHGEDGLQQPPGVGQGQRSISSERRHCKGHRIPDAPLFEVGSVTFTYAILMTGFEHFFLQLEDSCVEEITEKLGQVSADLPVPSMGDLCPGMYCVAQYSEDRLWYRARIEELLTGSQGDDWLKAALSKFAEMISDTRLITETVEHKDGHCVVKLWTHDHQQSLNSQLQLTLPDAYRSSPTPFPHSGGGGGGVDPIPCVSTHRISDPRSGPAQLLPPHVKQRSHPHGVRPQIPDPDLHLPEQATVAASHVDQNDCFLRICSPEHSVRLRNLEGDLRTIFDVSQRQETLEGAVCIAHTCSLYRRCHVNRLADNRAFCFFPDYGFSEWLPLEDLSPLDPSVNQRLAYQAFQCTLYGLDDFMSNDILLAELSEGSKNKMYMAEILKWNLVEVRLFCIVDGRSVFINEIIGRNLVAVGHAVNMSLFNSGTISGPASGRSSHGLDFPDSVSHPVVPLPISSATNIDSSERTSDLTLPGDARQFLTDMRMSVQVGQPPLRLSSSDNFSHTGSSMSTGCGGVPDVCSWMSVRDMDAADGAREIIGVPTNPPAGNAAWTGQQTGILADIRGALHDSLLPVNDFRHSPTTVPGGEELSSNHEDIERCRSLPLMMEPAVDTDLGGPCFTHPSLSFHAGSPFLSTDPIDLEHLSRPLPLYVTLPSEGVWFGVHIISVSDPSSFVIRPFDLMNDVSTYMRELNLKFQSADSPPIPHAPSEDTPTVARCLVLNHMYMVLYEAVYHRAIIAELKEECAVVSAILPDFCKQVSVEREKVYDLPGDFWSMPFSAFRCRLSGVKPACRVSSTWTQSACFTFCQLTLNKTLFVRITSAPTDREDESGHVGGCAVSPVDQSERVLSVQLVSTCDPDEDVVVAEYLLARSYHDVSLDSSA